MKNVFKKFYRSFYSRTSGFIPTKPINQNIYPGDFFQIRNGEMILLGNIFRNGIIAKEDIVLQNGIALNGANWNFNDGVSKPYSGRDQGTNIIDGEFKFSKQVLAFEEKGSFFFCAQDPEAVKLINWNEIENELIIKLTQTLFSFREVYVVTESAVASDWTLAIAGAEKAELEIATESESFGLVDLFIDANSKTIQARDIEYYHKETKKKPSFFKAKKLVVQQGKLDVFISDLIKENSQKVNWATDFYEYDFYHDTVHFPSSVSMTAQGCVLDMLQANQLNPNTALSYFKWEDANLDDIEKLFTVYGY
ncbi:hypothetical protein GCM10011344_35290 [Dokdonia pacifica]|uniref:Uncharacterized protein n=1 Tax=Dokdonia pacifica TaxID=1627892 RepID=A0A239AQI8_9FLAO|nr:hypothetical protein [Dokdonia pacifica]GGG31313.1 hypothetical protein GCM10011344_35290 [Dokdonia pacifica]SNR97976.1 hypothetical protein SAMN06265376_10575 [Dokdonia pacifica]